MQTLSTPFQQERYRNSKCTYLNFSQLNCHGECTKRKSIGQFTKDPDKQLCNVCFARKPKAA